MLHYGTLVNTVCCCWKWGVVSVVLLMGICMVLFKQTHSQVTGKKRHSSAQKLYIILKHLPCPSSWICWVHEFSYSTLPIKMKRAVSVWFTWEPRWLCSGCGLKTWNQMGWLNSRGVYKVGLYHYQYGGEKTGGKMNPHQSSFQTIQMYTSCNL